MPDIKDQIRAAVLAELQALKLASTADLADTVAYTEKKARELAALVNDPGFSVAADMARRACLMRAVTNGVLAADALDDAGWNTAFGVMVKVLGVAAGSV